MLIRTFGAAALALTVLVAPPSINGAFAQTASEKPDVADSKIADLSLDILTGSEEKRRQAIEQLTARANPDIIATFTLLMRISGEYKPLSAALTKLTGQEIVTWRDAMLWQEAHPEIKPHPSYREIKMRWFASIDSNFLQFFPPIVGSSWDAMKIRLEEITWGGVQVDGIPSLDNPKLIEAKDASYLKGDDLVFGVDINGDVRAYPLRIMGWHEMFNEVIGGVPVALAYCTLCGSGILFETAVEGRAKPFVFGSSGFLYRSNKLMFDRETNSLWNQFTGEPVSGPLVSSDIKLKIRPVAITSWAQWLKKHPNTKVLDIETGHNRDYGSGVVYKEYFASPELMFPTIVRDESILKRKDYVFGVREFGTARAWPLSAFTGSKIINDKIGTTDLVLIGNAATRTVRAYQSEGRKFSPGSSIDKLVSDDGEWTASEDFLTGPNGQKLARVAGHIAYWFAWDGYLGVKSSLYKDS